ncbi:MAG: hypothetical protein HW416_3976 [Chloroflexi bacterium]|nr:hypothetical protein [Chloroflexota bacterium]
MTTKIGLALLHLWLGVAILAGPSLSDAHEGASVGGFQVITSTIGDFDCFGYGAPAGPGAIPLSPCGTLPDLPIADVSDPPYTDLSIDCSVGNTFYFTHTLDIPVGATIFGGAVVLNVGGIQKVSYTTTITADGIPAASIPDTGALGTGLVIIPLVSTLTSLLNDGQVVVTIRHGATAPVVKCEPVFVDFSSVSILVHIP